MKRSNILLKVDEFKIQCVALGPLRSLKIWLEASPRKSAETWCLDWIHVIEEETVLTSTIVSSTNEIVRQPPVFFYADQWLHTGSIVNDLELFPTAHAIDRIFGNDEESDFAFPAKILKLVSTGV